MTRYYRDGRLTEEWERDALAATQAYARAMRRAEAAGEGRQTDPDRDALDEKVRAHMAAHPGVSYGDALDEVALTSALIGHEPEPVEVDHERQALDGRVMAFAAEHRLSYADALDRVLSEP